MLEGKIRIRRDFFSKKIMTWIIIAMMTTTSFFAMITNAEKQNSNIIELKYGSKLYVNNYVFDINKGEPRIPRNLKIDRYIPGTKGLYLIHMKGPVYPEWRKALENLGVKILNYVPNYAYLVQMKPEIKNKAEELSFVDWIGFYHPAYKLDKNLHAGKIIIHLIPGANTETINKIHNTIPVLEDKNTYFGRQILADVNDESKLNYIAGMNDVYFISPYVEPQLYCEVDSQIIGGGCWVFDDDDNPSTPYRVHGDYGAYVNQKGYDGSGVVVGIADGGLGDGTTGNAGHNDFTGRVMGGYYWSGSTWHDGYGHGTHCAGLIAADTYHGNKVTYVGFGPYYVAQGLAYGSSLYAEKIFDDSGSWIGPNDYYDIPQKAKQNAGAYVHSNSWGDSWLYCNGAYDASDEAYDRAVRDADSASAGNQPIVIVVAAGNSGSIWGFNSIGSPANGKNVISVGACESYMPDATSHGCTDTNANNPDNIASFSSRGWTDDNRVKPDITAPGVAVLSTHSPDAPSNNLYGLYSEDSRYEWCSGTSQATPIISGAAAVVVQYYESIHGVKPSPAMVKSLLINAAEDMDNSNGNTGPIPNKYEGWGRVNLVPVIDPKVDVVTKDEETLLTTGKTDWFNITYDSNSEPLKITLVWTDKYALAGDSITLKNDLNLEVIAPNGDKYYGNAFVNGWTPANTGAMSDFDSNNDKYDDRNNVENIYIPANQLQSGTYTIKVIGYNIPADANNDGTANQDYALVIYNAKEGGSQPNGPPDAPVNPSPADGATGVGLNPTLSVDVSDPDGDVMDVTFYDASGGVIGVDTGVSSGGTASVVWSGLSEKTVYSWYVISSDGEFDTQSSTWSFTTGDFTPPASPSGLIVEHSGSGGGGWSTIFYETFPNVDSGWAGSDDGDTAEDEYWIVDQESGDPASIKVGDYDNVQSSNCLQWNEYDPADWGGRGWIEARDDGGSYWNPSSAGWSDGYINFTYDYYVDADEGIRLEVWNGSIWSVVWSDVSDDKNQQPGWTTVSWHMASWVFGLSEFSFRFEQRGGGPRDYIWLDNVKMDVKTGGVANADNKLTWILSADDGAGENDVKEYVIYRSDSSSGPWDDSHIIATVSAGTNTYTDMNKGDADSTYWWYVVRARDTSDNLETNTNAVQEPNS